MISLNKIHVYLNRQCKGPMNCYHKHKKKIKPPPLNFLLNKTSQSQIKQQQINKTLTWIAQASQASPISSAHRN